MNTITDEMFYKMVDYRMSEPVSLEKADLNEPFIYDRKYGVFYVDSGMHILGMTMLYCWHKNSMDKRELFKNHPDIKAEVKENSYSSHSENQYLADKFLLEIQGTAMGSSVSNYILVGKVRNLNENEKIILGRFDIQELNI